VECTRLEDLPDFLTVEEAAACLRCSAGTLRRMIKQGQLRVEKVGRLDRVPRAQILKMRDGQ
jgi:excisionase family DNA binding protein